MDKITFSNKVDTKITSVAEINKVTGANLNEIKNVANLAVDQLELNTPQIASNKEDIASLINGNGKTYISVSNAMAVLPLPSNNTPFTIRDSTNNLEDGYYIYLSTEAGGYKFLTVLEALANGYNIVESLLDFDSLITNVTGGVWMIISDITLDDNKTIPLGVTLQFRNSKINLGGFTLTGLSTKIDAGLTQIFDTSGTVTGMDVKEAYPQWFGAVGDGSINDTDAIQLSLNSGFKNINGSGLTYKIISTLTISDSDITLHNLVLDTSATSGEIDFITASGTQGSNVTLTSDTLIGSNTITVGDTSTFVVDGYAYISSDQVFSATQTVLLGQIVKIKSKTSTELTLHDDVLYDFTYGAGGENAVVAPISTLNNLTFKDINFIGANDIGNSQTALRLNKCFNSNVTNCTFDYYSYASVVFNRCIYSKVSSSSTRFARLSGLAYGFVIINGCYSVSVTDCFSQDQRHMVTIGGSEGVNLYIGITGNHVSSATDAGIDAHPSCDFMVIDGNTVEAIDSTPDGIIFQGQNCVISNNIVVGNLTQGIRVQVLTGIGTASALITGNSISNIGSAGTSSGILINNDTTGSVNSSGVIVSNNNISGSYEYGIYVLASNNGINNIVVSGNTFGDSASTNGIYLRSQSGAFISNLSITGNVIPSTGSQGIYLFAVGSIGDISKGTINGNTIGSATFGIRLIKTSDIVISGNQNQGTSRKVNTTTTSGTVIDQSASPVITMTNSTYTVLPDAEYLIASRTGTITVTLPLAYEFEGRVLNIKTTQTQQVVSGSSDVVPINDISAGTAILPSTDGAWVLMKSDGTNWVVMQSS
tara:strand:+ start:166 stop:2625 length:2460 start_codon:yes stop_codon:yes gene_type:complete